MAANSSSSSTNLTPSIQVGFILGGGQSSSLTIGACGEFRNQQSLKIINAEEKSNEKEGSPTKGQTTKGHTTLGQTTKGQKRDKG